MDGRTISNETLSNIHNLYAANDSSLGGPFHTGDSLFDRASAWYGDNMYLGPRRLFFEKAASLGQKLFAYYYQEFVSGMDPNFGGKMKTSNRGGMREADRLSDSHRSRPRYGIASDLRTC